MKNNKQRRDDEDHHHRAGNGKGSKTGITVFFAVKENSRFIISLEAGVFLQANHWIL